ncbi:DUF1838 family protein [aff. Roholtiella sp. LEGE 12411]|uniref:DUF1838 family protein n=1 Tax=aff. Roholtiella sp. LEGE 12411 TaxID=1828822 RepID=UPI001FC8CE4C|nr:DUF1838 family protein [aff. Roholtiella sp. LEGE 12411]
MRNSGKLRFETTIFRVDFFEQLHPQLVKLVREKVPIYEFTPTESDEPNLTSIQYFKKHFESYLQGNIFPFEELGGVSAVFFGLLLQKGLPVVTRSEKIRIYAFDS